MNPTTTTATTATIASEPVAAPAATWSTAGTAGPDGEVDDDPGTSFARCSDGHGTLAALFFSDDDHDIARAKAICAPCGLRAACLAGAIERQEPCGVWGGKVLVDGAPVEFKRRRGRPPKHPRPLLVVDEVPVPPHLVA